MESNKKALRKLQQIVASQPSEWHEQAEFRLKNKKWLLRSQAVAIKVLRSLREQGVTQKELAFKLGVSPQQVNKWVKGGENFTFETISKLENALGIELMAIDGLTSVNISHSKMVYVSAEIEVSTPYSQEFTGTETFSECKVIDIVGNNDWIRQSDQIIAG